MKNILYRGGLALKKLLKSEEEKNSNSSGCALAEHFLNIRSQLTSDMLYKPKKLACSFSRSAQTLSTLEQSGVVHQNSRLYIEMQNGKQMASLKEQCQEIFCFRFFS